MRRRKSKIKLNTSLLGIDELCVKLKINTKQWIFELFSALNFQIDINFQMECYLLNCFNIIKEVCRSPPKNLAIFSEKYQINKEIFYILLDYFIILDERKIFEDFFDLILLYSENCHISYKFLVIQKKFIIKYFNFIIINDSENETLSNELICIDSNINLEIVKINSPQIQLVTHQNEILENLTTLTETHDNKSHIAEKCNNDNNYNSQESIENQQYVIVENPQENLNQTSTTNPTKNSLLTNNNTKKEINPPKEIFKKFMEFCMNSLKINVKDIEKSSKKSSIFPFSIFFSKNKSLISKELDGNNIIDFFTILNICEVSK